MPWQRVTQRQMKQSLPEPSRAPRLPAGLAQPVDDVLTIVYGVCNGSYVVHILIIANIEAVMCPSERPPAYMRRARWPARAFARLHFDTGPPIFALAPAPK